MFIAALFTIAKIWTQTKCTSVDKWIKKQCTYTMEYDSIIKKLNPAFCNNVGGPRRYYAETEKDKCHMISFICGT